MADEQTPQDNEIQEGKIFGVIAYISILCIIPLLLKKENKFALYHGKQGLVLFIIEVATVLLGIIPILGLILSPIIMFISLALSLWGIIQALMGNYARLPVISELAEKISL